MNRIARVVVDLALNREFDYLIPDSLRDAVRVGSRVRVPFGRGMRQGYVVALAEQSQFPHLKPLASVVGKGELLTPALIALAEWMAKYYCCPIETAIRAVLPEAVQKEGAGFRQELRARLSGRFDAARDLERLRKKAPKQAHALTLLLAHTELSLAQLAQHKVPAAAVRALEKKGLVITSAARRERDPFAQEVFLPTEPLQLSREQQSVLEKIQRAMEASENSKSPIPPPGETPRTDSSHSAAPSLHRSHVILLHGVTGSGKTEVYLQAIEQALARGRGAIVLVPEISLTPQMVERFKARFSGGRSKTAIAVLHSHLSEGERHDEWHKIRDGRARIVIGARSAIFAPVEPLGIIIVDEEHETTYKQEDAPRYNARDVAVMRGAMEKCAVLLGSATPSLESYYNAQHGKYQLAVLPRRLDGRLMPRVKVVDMRMEKRSTHHSRIFSEPLKDAIHRRLEKGEQVILFLNRRGYSTSLICHKCGYVAQCGACSVSLTYHKSGAHLLCHLCGRDKPAPAVCPQCRDPQIRYSGVGTERIEEVMRKLFPKARTERMDSDTMTTKEGYRRVLSDFRTGKINVLVGTQMIAKGLHFPNVTLVGILHADLALHLPDFRAGEHTFSLITQVAGRAGRGDIEGEVIVQTFTPFHEAVKFARNHDYAGFYAHEIEFREQLAYPPATHMTLITLRARNEQKTKMTAEALAKQLRSAQVPKPPSAEASSSRNLGTQTLRHLDTIRIDGPAPAPIARIRGHYRYQISLRGPRANELSSFVGEQIAAFKLPDTVHLAVDVDPLFLM